MNTDLTTVIRALATKQPHASPLPPAGVLEIIRKSAFLELKPKCVAVSQLVLTAHLNPKLAQDLTGALVDLYDLLQQTAKEPYAISQGLGDYVFFPLSHVFRQQGNFTDRILELTLRCVHVLISTCWQVDINKDLAKQLIILVTFMIGGKPGSQDSVQASEETKLAGCHCLKSLFGGLRASATSRASLIDVEMIPAVGHCVTTLLDCLKQASSVDLQITSVEALENLVECISDDDVLASFFPGVVSVLSRVLDPRTSGQRKAKSIAASLKLLSKMICQVLDDVKTLNLKPEEELSKNILDVEASGITTTRTSAWLKGTSAQVNVALAGVLRLRTHRMLSVRRALYEFCRDLLQYCSAAMNATIPVLIETLVVFATDVDDALAKKSEESVNSLVGSNGVISNSLQMGLHGWIISLPRNLQSNDEDKKAKLLKQISISFKILGQIGLGSEVLQDALSENLRDGILSLTSPTTEQNVEALPANVSSISMELISANNRTSVSTFPEIIMAHKSQLDTINRTRDLLEMLGQSTSSMELAQRHIREAGAGSADVRSTSLWIAINILRGSFRKDDDWLVDSTTTLIQRRAVEDLYSVGLSSLLETYDDVTASPAMNCMALEAISLAAEYLKSEFKVELVEALYPVVHLLGSSSAITQTHGIICLNNLARFCDYSSTKELLLENVDYMVNAVSLKLNMFDISPQAPIVLLMMIKLAGPSLVPYLDDLVVSIFAALDSFHGYQKLTELLFSVLRGIVDESVKGGRDQFLIKQGNDVEIKVARRALRRSKEPEIADLLKELELFGISRDHLEPLPEQKVDEETQENGHDNFPQKPWGKPKDIPTNPFRDDGGNESAALTPAPGEVSKPTPSYSMLQSITRLSQYYLTHASLSLRLQLLQLITTASPFLALNEDEFLPLVNQLWPVIVDRLSDAEPHVVIAAIEAIAQLCRDCGDFLSSRINETWTLMKKLFLSVKRQVDEERARGGLVVYAQQYRVWDAMLNMYEAMVEYTSLEERVVDEVLQLVVDYVDDEGREGLKKAFGATEMDAMWLELQSKTVDHVSPYVPAPVEVEGESGQRMLQFKEIVF